MSYLLNKMLLLLEESKRRPDKRAGATFQNILLTETLLKVIR